MNSPELIPCGVPLPNVPGLKAAQIKTLRDAWILTAQELVAVYGANAATRTRLAAALGLTRPALAKIIGAAEALIPAVRDARTVQMEEEAAQAHYRLGALLDEPNIADIDNLSRHVPESRAVLPVSVSLLDQMPPVRSQGDRGTCVAHAVLAVREQLEIAVQSPADLDLSEQYVYWWCKAHDNIPKVSGTYLSVGMRCLAEMGVPLEDAWPYVSVETEDQGQGPPPAAVAAGDPAFRTWKTEQFSRNDIDGIKACLCEGRTVAFSVPVYDSWYASSSASRWGKITLPLPGETSKGGHAMTLVGYQDDADAPGGGYFLVRNSWQPWSWDGAWRPHYGYIPYAYIRRLASAVFSATRVNGAEVYLRDRADEPTLRTRRTLTWNSPDIWLRHAADDGIEHQPAQPGLANAIYVRTFNRGPVYAYEVRAEIFAAPAAPYIAPGDWHRIGHVSARWLMPGETVLGPLSWIPPARGPYSLLARLSTAEQSALTVVDSAVSNLVAQCNVWQAAAHPGEPVEVSFRLAGAGGRPGATSLQVARGDLPAAAKISPIRIGPGGYDAGAAQGREPVDEALWEVLPGAVLLDAGQFCRATLAISLPADAEPGARYTVGIEQRQGKVPIGRLTVRLSVA